MAITVKRITLALNKQDLKRLNRIIKKLGITQSGVIKTALILLEGVEFGTYVQKTSIPEI